MFDSKDKEREVLGIISVIVLAMLMITEWNVDISGYVILYNILLCLAYVGVCSSIPINLSNYVRRLYYYKQKELNHLPFVYINMYQLTVVIILFVIAIINNIIVFALRWNNFILAVTLATMLYLIVFVYKKIKSIFVAKERNAAALYEVNRHKQELEKKFNYKHDED